MIEVGMICLMTNLRFQVNMIAAMWLINICIQLNFYKMTLKQQPVTEIDNRLLDYFSHRKFLVRILKSSGNKKTIVN